MAALWFVPQHRKIPASIQHGYYPVLRWCVDASFVWQISSLHVITPSERTQDESFSLWNMPLEFACYFSAQPKHVEPVASDNMCKNQRSAGPDERLSFCLRKSRVCRTLMMPHGPRQAIYRIYSYLKIRHNFQRFPPR